VTAVRIAAAGLTAAALAAAGCGEDRGGADSTNTVQRPEARPPLPAATFAIAEKEYRLSPTGARLDRPANVEIHVSNEGRRMHALAVRAPGGLRSTTPLAPGANAVVTVALDRPGRYVWFCPLGDHESRGMRGAIVVKPPASGGARSTPPKEPEPGPSSY
jgi:PQQ system protein